jgi:hypothetical protein
MQESSLRKYALIAEIVSAVAVVVSLVFVALQIKDNTDAVRAATYDDILSDHIQWRMTIASSPELNEAMVKDFTGAAPLTPTEEQARNWVAQAAWQIFERAYFARKYQTLGDSEWERYEAAICRSFSYRDFESELAPYLTAEFAEYARECAQEE